MIHINWLSLAPSQLRAWITMILVVLGASACNSGGTLAANPAAVDSISLTPSVSTLVEGTQEKLTVTATFGDKSTKDVTRQAMFVSSDKAVATVDDEGNLTAKASGTTKITATLYAQVDRTATAVVLVTNTPLVSIAVTAPNSIIAKGTTEPFTAIGTFSDTSTLDLTSTVVWSSSDTGVTTVSNLTGSQGFVTGLLESVSTISATLDEIVGAKVLSVSDATLTSIVVTPQAATIAKSTTQAFTATGTFSDNTTQDLTRSVTWASSTAAVASISNVAGSNGLVTGLDVGTTTILAALGSTSGTQILTVDTLSSLTVSPTDATITVDGTQQFTATGQFSSGATQDLTTQVTWSSSSSSVSVSNTAPEIGLATGSEATDVDGATIFATLESIAETASATLHVN